MTFHVFVPAVPGGLGIAAGAGIVSSDPHDARDEDVTIDYEEDRHGAVNLSTFADRVALAAGRHAARYPTSSRRQAPRSELVEVGTYNNLHGVIHLAQPPDGPATAGTDELVAWWCGLRDVTDLAAQLQTTGAHHQLQREVTAALASRNPTLQHAARILARRHNLQM